LLTVEARELLVGCLAHEIMHGLRGIAEVGIDRSRGCA
jgi:hypothetical protein